ncbi:protein PXR1-like [Oryza brachyantha]|uniref:KED-like protein n=1 Tax=Oryza brachyantha TaxID=4533 RepID=J3MST4_ORYBR|nr:protein PXR1-like [Oryza brachyantha]
MESADVTKEHPKEEIKDKEHAEEAKPAKEKKEKKEKTEKKKKKEKVEETTDAAKLRAKLEKLDAKIDDLKAKKQEIVVRLLQLEKEATANAAADQAAPPASG